VTEPQSTSPSIHHLRELGVEFRVFVHSGHVSSLEQAAEERGQRPEQIVRSILFRISSGEYAMALMPGPRQISWKALRAHFNTNRLTLATPEEVLHITGFEIGAVNPFGLPHPMRILIDNSLLAQESVSIGSGIRGTGIILHTTTLVSALPQAEFLDLSNTTK
jgi:Cys-tRNA(Pro)/Cys-tRNA(Cys) deacylase